MSRASTPESRLSFEKTLEEVLEELGTFGFFQLRIFCFILIGIMANAIYNAQYVFNAAAVRYRCLVPECEIAADDKYETGSWSEWTLIPGSNCERYAPSEKDADCEESDFTNTPQPCTAWIYEANHTIVAEFGLACRDWQRAIVGTAHNVGVFFALLIVGLISDSIGRRATFIITATSSGVVGLIRSFSSSFLMYVILEFFDAFVGSGSYSSGYILAVEMMDTTKRVKAGSSMSSFFAVGQIILALIAWAVPYWRTLTIILYTPALFFPAYFFILEESVRWLLSKGKKDKAIALLLRAAKYNKRHISPETLERLTVAAEESRNAPKVSGKSVFKEVIRSSIIRKRLLICSFVWTTTTLVYYGLSINSVTLGDNMYTSYIFMSMVEIPGYIASMLLLDRIGRKTSLMGAFILCGITLVFMPFISNKYVTLALSLLGKACISMVFTAIYIFTLELFPTTARHTLMNVCSTIGRIGSMTAPLSPLLAKYMESLPFLLFGSMALIASLLLVWTPETLNRRLPDTVLEAESIYQGQLALVSKRSMTQEGQQNKTADPGRTETKEVIKKN